jgi:LmbE family N-acetylglucosaminyl deacetylase
MFNRNKKLKILAIGAHGDDIELGCGGTLAKAIKQGHEVTMVVVTGTGFTDLNGKVIRTQELAEKEIKDAAKVLGVSSLHVLNYDDTSVPYSVDLINDLENIICSISPDIIFTHFIFDTHQDHIRTAHSTISASRNQNTILLYEPINPSGQGYVPFRPQVYVDISNYVDFKTEALKSHVSQYERYSEKWISGVKSRAKFRGFEIGVEYAECFEVVRIEMKFDNILENE